MYLTVYIWHGPLLHLAWPVQLCSLHFDIAVKSVCEIQIYLAFELAIR